MLGPTHRYDNNQPKSTMSNKTTILAPIRYPLTKASTQTLSFANDLFESTDKGEVYVLHVNIFQNGDKTRQGEIRQAISPLFEEFTPTVITRSGFLVEEIISTEAVELGADVIVVGKSQKPKWRRLVSTLVGNEPAVESHLREQTTATVEVVE